MSVPLAGQAAAFVILAAAAVWGWVIVIGPERIRGAWRRIRRRRPRGN